MQRDERGRRVAVVADGLINSLPSSGLDALAVLERAGWGVIVLPPRWYPDEVGVDLFEQSAEQIEETARHGYDLVCVGDCERLRDPLRRLEVELPDSITPSCDRELEEFLRGRVSSTPRSGSGS